MKPGGELPKSLLGSSKITPEEGIRQSENIKKTDLAGREKSDHVKEDSLRIIHENAPELMGLPLDRYNFPEEKILWLGKGL